ncbi:MAG TPA: type B 50S ribosomal protein L31 [Chlamydiales bacterium]|jgi:large subunit ribosomal protein L31
MKEKIHPQYQTVLFVDSSTGAQFLIGSTLQPKEKGTFEGKEYPLCKVPISSSSHPFFTKANQFIDSEGRVDRFAKKYQRKSEEIKKTQEKQEEAKKEKVKAATKSAKKK